MAETKSNKRPSEEEPEKIAKISKSELVLKEVGINKSPIMVSLKAIDGNIDISSITLNALSNIREAKEVEMKYPLSTVIIVVDWMYSSMPLQCQFLPTTLLIQLLKFAEEYGITRLTEDIYNYYQNVFSTEISDASLINTILKDDSQPTLYNMAITRVVNYRRSIYMTKCCSATYISPDCCAHMFTKCRNPTGKCCKHQPKSVDAKGKLYLDMVKDVPHKVLIDIDNYDMANL